MSEQEAEQKRPSRSPYAFAILGAFALVLTAWVARDFYQPIGPGIRAPEFEYPNLAGEAVSLQDHRGEVVLVNIWATWCAPCREEMPSMQRLYDEFGDEDFEILAVSIDARRGQRDPFGRPGGDIGAFTDSLKLTFPILHNPSGRIQQLYQTTGVPESFVVDRDGTIHLRIAGPTNWDAEPHKQMIRRLLGGGSTER